MAGYLFMRMLPNQPAPTGLHFGDIIVKFDGTDVVDGPSYNRAFAASYGERYRKDERVPIVVHRGGRLVDLVVTSPWHIHGEAVRPEH